LNHHQLRQIISEQPVQWRRLWSDLFRKISTLPIFFKIKHLFFSKKKGENPPSPLPPPPLSQKPSSDQDLSLVVEPSPQFTMASLQTPQLATQTLVPINSIFSSIHASLSQNHNHQTPLPNFQTQNTAETHT
jgi:hypothetical protein